jgi:EF hand domain-containing protein
MPDESNTDEEANMRKLILGVSAMAVMASAAAFADEQENTRLAAAESSTTVTFTKLDADADGRISAIEAASNSKVAAGFTQSDSDKDGYLSKAEFSQLASSMSSKGTMQPRTRPEPAVPSDSSETAPQPRE